MDRILTTAITVHSKVEEQIGTFSTESKVEAAEDEFAEIRIPHFNGSGYEIWSTKMKALFLSLDLWDLVQRGYAEKELTVEALHDVRMKDVKALILILQAVDKSVFSCIANANKSKDAWDALQKEYQGNTEEPNRKKPVDEFLFSCLIARATKVKEAYWYALPRVFQVNTNVLYMDYEGIAHFMFKSP